LTTQWRKKLGLNGALGLVKLAKSTWYDQLKSKPDKYRQIKLDLRQTVIDNAPYGYRRAHSELTDKDDGYGHQVGREKVRLLMKNMAIQVANRPAKPKPGPVQKVINEAGEEINLVAKLEEKRKIKIGEVGVTDFTEIVYDNGTKKVQLMTILDYASRVVLGWEVSPKKNTVLALTVWRQTRIQLKKLKFPIKKFIVHSDQDSVLTGHAWVRQLLIEDQAQISYSTNGCHGNTRMESWHSRFKGENKSLFADCKTVAEVREKIKQQVRYYNYRRRHSALKNKAPMRYIKIRLNLPV
jgi:transposase InsO family protein